MARYKEQDKKASHDKILRSAAQAFRTQGYNGVGLADIAKGAGLTHGTFYAHFNSKEELLSSVIQTATESRAQTIQAIPLSGRSKATAIIDWYLGEEHFETPTEGCLMPGMARDLREHRAASGRTVDRYLHGFLEIFESCGIRPPTARLLASALIGALTFARCSSKADAKLHLAEVRNELVQLLEEK